MVRRAASAAAIVLWLVSTSAAFSRGAMMFPVAPGGPGDGLWKVEQWPDHGCTTCTIDEADAVGFRKFLTNLGRPTSEGAEVQLPVYVVRGGIETGHSSLAELNKAAANCKIGSVGVLLPNTTTGIVAFGVRLDCNNGQSSFMSVVMSKAHMPAAVYWLPDGPIVSL